MHNISFMDLKIDRSVEDNNNYYFVGTTTINNNKLNQHLAFTLIVHAYRPQGKQNHAMVRLVYIQ